MKPLQVLVECWGMWCFFESEEGAIESASRTEPIRGQACNPFSRTRGHHSPRRPQSLTRGRGLRPIAASIAIAHPPARPACG